MKQRPSLLALSALLLCTAQYSSPAASVVRGRNNVGLRQTNISTRDANHSHESRPSPKLQGATKEHLARLFCNTSRGNGSTLTPERSSGQIPKADVGNEEGIPPVCAYRVIEGGIGGQLCFRHALSGYKCHKGDCRTVVSVGNLVANILLNGSVLLQWAQQGESSHDDQAIKAKETKTGTNMTSEETVQPDSVFGGRRHRRRGFELSCWWNGSYTQFECAGVHLGPGCKDFLLAELHENIPYRLCLRPLERRRGAEHRDCVEFTLPPSGMQDIVIAMTTVGGAICVMLVIICLLVAYITENIMSPTTQHTYSYRTHTRH